MRCLIVDDVLSTLSVITETIESKFPTFACTGTSSFEKAVELIKSYEYNVLIADYILGEGKTGIELCKMMDSINKRCLKFVISCREDVPESKYVDRYITKNKGIENIIKEIISF